MQKKVALHARERAGPRAAGIRKRLERCDIGTPLASMPIHHTLELTSSHVSNITRGCANNLRETPLRRAREQRELNH